MPLEPTSGSRKGTCPDDVITISFIKQAMGQRELFNHPYEPSATALSTRSNIVYASKAMANTEVADDRGLYCSTAGTYFTNKDALADHYKSEFHR